MQRVSNGNDSRPNCPSGTTVQGDLGPTRQFDFEKMQVSRTQISPTTLDFSLFIQTPDRLAFVSEFIATYFPNIVANIADTETNVSTLNLPQSKGYSPSCKNYHVSSKLTTVFEPQSIWREAFNETVVFQLDLPVDDHLACADV
jgi:hypothetical protein